MKCKYLIKCDYKRKDSDYICNTLENPKNCRKYELLSELERRVEEKPTTSLSKSI